MHTSSARCSPC